MDTANKAPAESGRDGNGRFAKGNGGGPGNPYAGRVATFRKLLYEALTEEELKAIVDKLIEIAKEGNFSAIKVLLSYYAGKPGSSCFEAPANAGFCESVVGLGKIDLTAGLDLSGGRGAPGSDWLGMSSGAPLTNGVFDEAGGVSVLGGKKTGNGKSERQDRA